MPKKPIDEDRARRKEELEQKREARRRAAAAKEQEEKKRAAAASSTAAAVHSQGNVGRDSSSASTTGHPDANHSFLLRLPEVALQDILSFLPAADLGRLTMSCKSLNETLGSARVPFLVQRLAAQPRPPGHPWQSCTGLYSELLSSRSNEESEASTKSDSAASLSMMEEARLLLEQSLAGETGRVLPKNDQSAFNEFVAYARFLDESVAGHATILGRKKSLLLPRFLQGRFASASPEHSLCRVGGDGQRSGAGGSGAASWGVGRRGQLGHGRRQDERLPKRLMGGIGYGIRIVQVSAGGGLVRVAHSLLLTDAGKVLSFGAGQYGALGHGYSSGKQLPDLLKPQYVQALSHLTTVCVAAGELHSAVVTSDGDVYTWGDGFCGQLGHADKRPQVLPKQVLKGGLEDECVESITCGSRHSIAVTEEGEVFTWGLGHFGCLGRSFTPFDYDADTAVATFTGAVVAERGADAAVRRDLAVAEANIEAPLLAVENDPPPERDFAAELVAHLDLITTLTLDDNSNQCVPCPIESLRGIRIVGSSAGHRHSLFLSEEGFLYSCGAGIAGCLGHGDASKQMHPLRIAAFDHDGVRIRQMSAGVDMSMAVCTRGNVYAWGRADGGRLGLGLARNDVLLPRKVSIGVAGGDATAPVKAVDVECGYVHSLIVGLDGTIHLCGNVGVDGEADGIQQRGDDPVDAGRPTQVPKFNIWHRIPEPKDEIKKERWKKLGKYEVKGRTKMMSESKDL
jgi:E3 ubiquitin-protein ligase HERC2